MPEATSAKTTNPRGLTSYFLALAGVITIWGSSFVVVNVAVKFAPPMAIAMWRLVFASLSLFIISCVLKKRQGHPSISPVQAPPVSKLKFTGYLVGASLSGISFLFPVQYTAISLVGASIPALMVCLVSPALIALFSALIFKEGLKGIQVIGLIIASIGTFLIISQGNITQITPGAENFVGNLLAAFQPVLWTSYTLFIKQLVKYRGGFQITTYTTYIGTLGLFFLSPLFLDLNQWFFAIFQVEVVGAVLYLALACSVFGYLVWNQAQKHIPSAKVGAFLYVEPFITVLFAWVFLGDLIEPISLLGGVIVLVALVLITGWKPNSVKDKM